MYLLMHSQTQTTALIKFNVNKEIDQCYVMRTVMIFSYVSVLKASEERRLSYVPLE
jgi:hypothetical protein